MIPQDQSWYEIIITDMHSPNFWSELIHIIRNNLAPGHRYGALICPRSEKGPITLGPLVHFTTETTEEWLRNHFEPILAKKEEDYNEEFSLDTKIKLIDLGSISQRTPSSPTSATKKVYSKTTSSSQILQAMQTMQETQIAQTNAILEAIKTQQQSPTLNWTPLIQAVATAIPAVVGVPVSLATPNPVTPASPTTSTTPAAPVSEIQAQLESLTSTVNTLALTQREQSKTLESLSQGFNNLTNTVAQLSQGFNTLTQIVAATKGTPSNGSSTPPAAPSTPPSTPAAPAAPSSPSTPASQSSEMLSGAADSNSYKPINFKLMDDKGELVDASMHLNLIKPKGSRQLHSSAVIHAAKAFNKELNPNSIVTADLESLITEEGLNRVFMAAWYNGIKFRVFDISQSQFNMEPHLMLRAFWLDLLQNNHKCTVYFHNWAGYDAILSLAALISLHEYGYTFNPIVQDGKVISLTVLLGTEIQLTIKDSIKVIPGSLAKLAKDFKVETQKDHFPHYFNPLELCGLLDWEGSIPEYKYFEPKRTTPAEYEKMAEQFKNKPWNFLEVSRQYIQGDVIALYQILISFFKGLKDKFPINPIKKRSAPGIAFTTWKTV